MKATVKQIAATTLIAFLFLAINVKAEGTERTASGQAINESALELENWMTNETIWNTNFAKNDEFVLESETNLELEDWMTNTESWSFSFDFAEEVEPALELESWMTSEVIWNTIEIEAESALLVEPWMLSENIWK